MRRPVACSGGLHTLAAVKGTSPTCWMENVARPVRNAGDYTPFARVMARDATWKRLRDWVRVRIRPHR